MPSLTVWMLVIVTQAGAATTIPHEFSSKDACIKSFEGAQSSRIFGVKENVGWCFPIDKPQAGAREKS